MRLDRPFRGSAAVARGELTEWRLRGREFVALGPDVYVAACVPVDQLLMARAAMLRHPEGAITGAAAATLWGAGEAVADARRVGAPTEILVPGAGIRSRGGLEVRRAALDPDEVTVWPDGPESPPLRLTSPARTFVEVARRLATVDAVVVGDALARRCGLTPTDVVALADRRSGERGMARVRAAAALVHPGADTPRRTRTRLGVLLTRLPPPLVDVIATRRADEAAVGALDLAWPATSSGVLLDRHPEVARACAEDLIAHGWEVVSLGAQGEQPVERVVERITAFLAHVDRVRWRDLPDIRRRFPRRPTAPRVFAESP
ncbi:MAG: hypothetical protein K0S40_2038 [Actinomycetospora sp.]|nr:hypothetical protein [Actinomycetospora sp.]